MSFIKRTKEKVMSVIDNDKVGELNGERAFEEDVLAPNQAQEKQKVKNKKPLFGGKKNKDKGKKDVDYEELDLNSMPRKNSNHKPVDTEYISEFLNTPQTEEQEDESISRYIKPTDGQAVGRTKNMISSELGINIKEAIPSMLATPEEVDDVIFSPVTRGGIDPDEVIDFVDKVTLNISAYREELEKRYNEVHLLLDEIMANEREELIRRNQEVLKGFIDNGKSEKETLQNELISSRLANSRLEDEIKRMKSNGTSAKLPDLDQDRFKKENERLKLIIDDLKAQINDPDHNDDNLITESKEYKELLDEVKSLKEFTEEQLSIIEDNNKKIEELEQAAEHTVSIEEVNSGLANNEEISHELSVVLTRNKELESERDELLKQIEILKSKEVDVISPQVNKPTVDKVTVDEPKIDKEIKANIEVKTVEVEDTQEVKVPKVEEIKEPTSVDTEEELLKIEEDLTIEETKKVESLLSKSKMGSSSKKASLSELLKDNEEDDVTEPKVEAHKEETPKVEAPKEEINQTAKHKEDKKIENDFLSGDDEEAFLKNFSYKGKTNNKKKMSDLELLKSQNL